MKKYILHVCLAAFALNATAQLATPSLPSTPTSDLATTLKTEKAKREIELNKVLNTQNFERRIVESSGRIKQVMYVTATGHLVYNTTYNIGAGRTLSTNKVWPGGIVGVSLTGTNMPNRLGIWDGGAVLTTHNEYNTRVTQVDGSPQLSDHATHVAGTMIASGVNPLAKGMAYQATLKAYDWTNDDVEMEAAAAAGMLVSNHSYGTVTGWDYNSENARWEWRGNYSYSTTEDYKFGQYDIGARNWDLIASQYPYYLICKAAGNDRGDNLSGSEWYYYNGVTPVRGTGTPPAKDGGAAGYDCLPTSANAKNILTVGAVNKIGGNTGNGWTQTSDVVMSSFSGWGPTDDGRVKPDVVSPGVSIYSSISTSVSAYESLDGTSMATPAASGSLLLVQQHYNNVMGRYLRSASLKGLAIHTADEAGNVGPDYTYGWGLLNTASCVQFINDSGMNRLEEKVLKNDSTQSLSFFAVAGKPLKVTICWTDVAGTPVNENIASVLDNPTRMLVNDLDIRLTRVSDGTIFSPYKLNPATPSVAATTGDNNIDNVEQIYIASPVSGAYTLTVKHKNSLVGSLQAYSLMISNGSDKMITQFTVNKSTICPNQAVTFNDASSGGVTERTWYFPGGTPSTSNALSPVVTYTTSGKFPVALKVKTAVGIDSVYKENFINVGGYSIPFNETFESNSPTLYSWGTVNPDAKTTWAYYSIGGTTPGNSAAGINLAAYATTGQRDGLISPPINLSTHTNPLLTFKHAYTRFGGNTTTDSLVIYGSTNCGSTWTRIVAFGENGSGSFATYQEGIFPFGSQTEFIPSLANHWCGGTVGSGCKTVPLIQFAGQASVVLKFESYNNYGNNLYIDNIVVDGTPKKPVPSFAGPTQGCVGTPIYFADKSTNIPTSWEWSVSGANPSTSTAQNPSFTFPTTGTYTIKLKVSNSGGSDSITQTNYITIVDKPTAPTIQANGPLSFCLGDSVLLTTDHVGNHKWYMNNILIAENVQQIYVKQNATYKIGASNGTCEAFADLSITVTPKPSPAVVTASIPGTAFCQGGSVTLTSNIANGNKWYRNNSEIAGANAKTYITTDSGAYSVKYAINNCEANMSNIKTLSLLTKPSVDAVVGSLTPVRGESNSYSVTAVSGNTYTWSTSANGTILSGNGTATISARFNTVDSGTVTVQSRSTAGCLSTPSSIRVLVAPAVGLNEFDANAALRIFPIPATSILHITFDAQQAQHGEIRLVNLLGQTVLHKQVNMTSGENAYELNIEQLPNGIYMVELIGESTKAVKRITKE